MTDFMINTERQKLQSFNSVKELNKAVSIHMETLIENSCKEKIMKLLSIMSQHSLQIVGVSWLSVSSMAGIIGTSERTVQRYTKELEVLGIIKIVQTKDRKRKGQTSNTYIILPAECHTDCQSACHPNLTNNLSSKNNIKDHKERNNDLDSTVQIVVTEEEKQELTLPTYLPERFVKVANLICQNEKEIVTLWNRVCLAYSKCNLDYSVNFYLNDIIRVLKGVIYKAKYGKIRNLFGYFYKGVLAQFDEIFSVELNNLI